MRRLIYPARRAVEHAVSVPGVRPLRLFSVLWPLFQVQTRAEVNDEQAYDVIDHFLVRAVAEAGIDSVGALAAFLALPAGLVQRCLARLALIDHVRLAGDRVVLTDLGTRSVRAGIRWEPKESRQTLLVERYTGRPLPRRYYDGAVAVLPTSDVPADQTADGSTFLHMFAATPFRPEVIHQLAGRTDRAAYNLPTQLRGLEILSCGDGYLPAYLIETAGHGLLAYTAAAEDRDGFLEQVCREVEAAGDLIAAEGFGDPRTIWTDWLATAGVGPAVPVQLPNGVWRATLPAIAFGDPPKPPVTRIGSYQLRRHHFLQLWCDDAALRRRAVLDRALGLARLSDVDTVAALERRAAELARALSVPAPGLDEIRARATATGAQHRLADLDSLALSG